MSLDEKFGPVRNAFYKAVENFFKKIASFLGYPTNTGMPTIADVSNEEYARLRFIEKLPTHETSWPPPQRPETWFEMIFGPSPKVETVPRYIYESMKRKKGFIIFILKIIKISIFYQIGYQSLYK